MNIKLPSLILVCGKPNSGKSYLIKYFMHTYQDKLSYGIVMSKTKFNDGFKYIPEKFIHPTYDEEKIKNLMKIQSDLKSKGIEKNAFIILDDCLTKEFNNELFTDLTTQFRHYNITLIISTQYIYKINPTIRECASYCIIFRQSTKRSLEALFDSFGTHFDNLNDFRNYITENTGDYKFIFIDVNSKDDNINKIYRVMKAPNKIPKFKLEFNKKI
jgi:hypothetical protein